MKLRDASDRYVLQLRADGRSEHTTKNYARHLRLLGAWLATYGFDDDLDAIRPEVLAAFLTSPEARRSAHGGDKTAISLNGLRTSMRISFAWFSQAGLARTNSARLVRRAVCSPAPPRALSDLEVRRLQDTLIAARGAVARRDHLLVDTLLLTGIRIGSALALDVEDVDITTNTLHLREVKGDRRERVLFGIALRDHLVGFLAGKPTRGPLFRNPQGERLGKRSAQARIALWMRRAGVDASVHCLRHTFGTRLLRKTGDLFLVKQAMLHRSIMSTAAYLSVSDERLRSALQ
jgi:site-specific recombinase XerD